MKPSILIVDDNADNRCVLWDTLIDEGYRLREASDGMEALEAVGQDPPDLVLLDIQMPRMDGITCCRQLKADPASKSIPVLLVTAFDGEDQVVDGLNAGATDYIVKPFSSPVVRARVRAALRAKLMSDELTRLAWYDGLTGLANRFTIMNRLELSLAQHRRDAAFQIALLFLDLDGFKRVNDTFGHAAGDLLLQSIAERLRTAVAEALPDEPEATLTVSRFSGDEFVILAEGWRSFGSITDLVARLESALAAPHDLDERAVTALASIGVVTSQHGYESAPAMLRDADAAMYRAKRLGAGRHVFFDEEMHRGFHIRLRQAEWLRAAVAEETLETRYEPVYRLDDGQLHGFEAVLHGHHGEDGPIESAALYALAAEIGLMSPLGCALVRGACRQIEAWQTAHPRAELVVTVRLDERQVTDPEVLRIIGRSIDHGGLDPRGLSIAVPGPDAGRATRRMAHVTMRLRDLGVGLALQDSGRGQMALLQHDRVRVDSMCLDASLTPHLANNRDYASIAQAIVTLAHNLGIKVTASNIADRQQLAHLQSLECDFGRGPFFAPALPARDCEPLIVHPHAKGRAA